MSKRKLARHFCGSIFAFLLLASGIAYRLSTPRVVPVSADSCTAGSPPLNGQGWIDGYTKTVYIDSSAPNATEIAQAANDFAAQTGIPLNVMPVGTAYPGGTDTIQFTSNPAASPANFATTIPNNLIQNGQTTNVVGSATVSFNTGAQITDATSGATEAAYDPTQPNASQFVYDTTLHELGHAFGLADIPEPADGLRRAVH